MRGQGCQPLLYNRHCRGLLSTGRWEEGDFFNPYGVRRHPSSASVRPRSPPREDSHYRMVCRHVGEGVRAGCAHPAGVNQQIRDFISRVGRDSKGSTRSRRDDHGTRRSYVTALACGGADNVGLEIESRAYLHVAVHGEAAGRPGGRAPSGPAGKG